MVPFRISFKIIQMSSRSRQPMPPPPEDEELEMDEDEEFEEPVDLFEALGSLMATEEGETIPVILNKIAQSIDMNNKIMIKVLATLNKMVPAQTNA